MTTPMPYQVEIVTDPRGFNFGLLKFSGLVGYDDLTQAFVALCQLDGFNAEIDNIWDYSEAELAIGLDEIQQLAEYFVNRAALRKGTPYVAMVSNNPSDIALIQSYIPMAARYPVIFELFSSRQMAIESLYQHYLDNN